MAIRIPKVGEYVHVNSRRFGNLYADTNGIITRILWSDGEQDKVIVQWLNSGDHTNIAADEFEGCYTERYGGYWIVEE